jgi:hypothetical protein
VNILESFLNTMILSFVELFYLVGILIAIGFLLGVLERFSNKYLYKAFGSKGILATAWIGTPIHELGHLIQCFIWGHRVTRVKFLQINSPDGVLGYVEHQYNPNSLYQQIGNFFIGMGPIFSGISTMIFGMYLLVPKSFQTFKEYISQSVTSEGFSSIELIRFGNSVLAISKSLFTAENLFNPFFWIFIVIAISISSHIALSRADIIGSAKGLLMLFLFFILFNIGAGIIGFDTYKFIIKLKEYNAYIIAFSSISLLFSFITLLGSYILYKLRA